MNQYNIPGLSIGIVRNDSIIYTKGYGVSSISLKDTVTENTIFHTGSVSKIFTALAIMHLLQDGLLSLDDRLVEIIPNLNYKDTRVQEISIKQLLNHTSGIRDVIFYNWSKQNHSDDALKNHVLQHNIKLKYAPSEKYHYSNYAYNILGYVVEVISGKLFEDYVKEKIFIQSNMETSDFRHFKIPNSLRSYPHSRKKLSKSVYQRKVYPYTREHAPSSTLNASAYELSLWMKSFINSLVQEKEPFLLNSMIKESTPLNNYIGLGFQLYNINRKKAFGHYGGDKGFRSYLMILPEDKIGMIILANADYDEDFRQEILHAIIPYL